VVHAGAMKEVGIRGARLKHCDCDATILELILQGLAEGQNERQWLRTPR